MLHPMRVPLPSHNGRRFIRLAGSPLGSYEEYTVLPPVVSVVTSFWGLWFVRTPAKNSERGVTVLKLNS